MKKFLFIVSVISLAGVLGAPASFCNASKVGQNSKKQAEIAEAETAAARAGTFFEKGRFKKAVPLYEEAIAENSENNDLYVKYSEACLEAGREERGADFLQKHLEGDPDNAAAHFGLGKLYGALKKYEEARLEYLKAMELLGAPLEMPESEAIDTEQENGIPE